MSGIYIPGDKVPTKCVGCSFRDPEYGGNCILMPSFDADTYEKQFDRCPFKELRKWFGAIPPHGDLIDKSGVEVLSWTDSEYGTTFEDGVLFVLDKLDELPVIISADGEDYEVSETNGNETKEKE